MMPKRQLGNLFGRGARRLVLIVSQGIVLCAGTGADARHEKPKRPETLVRLVDAAAALPPELAADTLLRVVESGRVSEREWQIQILLDAFQYAAQAKHSTPVAAAVSAALSADTDAGILSAALRSGLDRLSLRCRAVDRMVKMDGKRAMEMFALMGPPDLAPPSCSDALYPKPDPYFSTARNLMTACFTPKEREQAKDLQFAEGILRGVSTPAGIPPAVRLIQSTGGREGLVSLTGALLSALSQMRPDDRGLEGLAGSLSDHMYELAHLYLRDLSSAEPIVRAWRAYLVRVLGGTRCGDNAMTQGRSPADRLVQSFNARLAPLAPTVAPIAEDETKSTDTGDRANVLAFWSSPAYQRILQEFKTLRFGPPGGDGQPSPKGVLSMEDFVGEFEDWRSQRGPGAAPFHEASILYRGLIADVENDAIWRGALRGFIGLLKQSPLQRDDPPEWYLHFSALLNLSPKLKTEARRALIRQDIAALGDGLMTQLLERERLLGPPAR